MPLAIFDQRPGRAFELRAERVENDAPLFGILVGIERRHLARLLELVGLVHEQRRVAAVVDDQRRAAAVGPHQRLDRAPPVFGERLALPGEHRDAARVRRGAAGLRPADDDRGGRVILGREDVARHPAHVGAELGQRLDEHRGLNRHVQAAHDAGAGQRLAALVARAHGHQAGHLVLGQADFLAAPLGQDRSATLNGSRPACLAASNACISFTAVDIVSPFEQRERPSTAILGRFKDSAASPRRASCATAANSAGPFASGSTGNGRMRTSANPAAVSIFAHLLLGKPEPDVAHLLLILGAIVRQHVDDAARARPRLQRRARIRAARAPDRARGAAPAPSSRRRAARRRSAALRACRCRNSTPSTARQPRRAAFSMSASRPRRSPRATCGATSALTCPVPQPRSPTTQRRIEQAEQRVQMKRVAEQLLAQMIPLPRRGREELLGLRSPPREHARQPALVVVRAARCRHLLADQRPQPPRARVELVERHAVVAAGAVAPRLHPPRRRPAS